MRISSIVVCLLLTAGIVFAQNDRGTITGTVADPAGAVVANAAIEARHVETGALYQAASTETGNYTLAQLPAGQYEVSVTVPGFKKYVRQGLTVQVAQTLRIDVALEVGAASESVTVQADASLLKTESGELSHTIPTARLDELPVLGIGAQSASTWGIRNATVPTQLIPGTLFNSNTVVRVNGGLTNSQSIRVEGQDATDNFLTFSVVMTQPSVDAIQEVSIQTSNYSAEFGQVGGGVFNFTMKSGTNQFHGTAYDYNVNEAYNASQPYTNLKPVQRRNDYGFNIGGPVWIPHVYNGHDRTFFFFNLEQYREDQVFNTTAQTVPTTGMRNGDFSGILTNRNLGTDPLGRPIMENTIYDPITARVVGGVTINDPFSNNAIPQQRFDTVAAKIQNLIPMPTSTNLVNNIVPVFPSQTRTNFPAFKADQLIGPRAKLSFYASSSANQRQYSPGTGNADGLPLPITAARGNFIKSHTERLNFEYTLSPTLLLHAGAGYQHLDFEDKSPVLSYNAQQALGLQGATLNRNFPTLNGLCNYVNAICTGFGGMIPMGPNSQTRTLMIKPTANTSATWVRSNHTYKTGAEFRVEGYPQAPFTPENGLYTFNTAQTSLLSTNGAALPGGTVGFAYASFLLGLVNNGAAAVPSEVRMGKTQWGLYLQDSWKVTRRLTLDYGLRWDYSTYLREQYGRAPSFSPTTANPTAGGLPGAVIYEASCGCSFARSYPYAAGPRVGIAFQLTPKWVLRAGWGIVYTGTGEGGSAAANSNVPFTTPAFGQPAMVLSQGIPLTPQQLAWPNLSPGLYPLGGVPAALTPNWIDPNAGRPARQDQWSLGVQREINRNLSVEAAYVGNRGAWWQANALNNLNAITPQILAAHGLSLASSADITLLNSRLNSSTAIARGFSTPPYAAFPLNQTVAQSLRPFPQFTTINALWSPRGKTWYDSLQVKATKRFSHGLDFTFAFTWQKELQVGTESDSVGPGGVGSVVNDIFNYGQNKYLSGQDQTFTSVTALNYKLPVLGGNKAVSWAVRDWQMGAVLSYASGLPLLVPYANNSLNSVLFRAPAPAPGGAAAGGTGTFANRVPGAPLYKVDLNCHCFDPSTTFVLNRDAWTDPPAGQFGGSAAYYSDYRGPHRPSENFNFGRTFRVKERVSMQVRVEFTNLLNRAYFQTPTGSNAAASQSRNKNGTTNSGFGYINTLTPLAATYAAPGPRAGDVVVRFNF